MIKWEFSGNDWIYSIDVLKEKFIFLGSRDGSLHVLNWYGAGILKRKFNSWIGAIKIFNVTSEDNINKEEIYIFLGTKSGFFYCLEYCTHKNQLNLIYETKVSNTIRDIDITHNQSRENTYVAFGSEDRSVYILNFKDLISHPDHVDIKQVTPNGWIRSVAFCKDYSNNTFLLAAGCGDKHLYLYTIDGSIFAKICVDSKIHSILSDQISSSIYCTSDSNYLFLISPTDTNSYVINKKLKLPHRSTKIEFMGSDKILLTCEDNHIYIYDILSKSLMSAYDIGDKIFSLKDISIGKSNIMLVGHGQSKLSCYVFSLNNFQPKLKMTQDAGFIEQYDDFSSFLTFSKIYLYGPKSKSFDVGIGRFIHVSSPFPGSPCLCIIGTDEGKLVVIKLDDERKIIVEKKFEDMRIWSVYGYWKTSSQFVVFVANSNNKLIRYNLEFFETKPSLIEDEIIELHDWPREIRPITNSKKHEFVIACENGDLIFYGNKELNFNAKQTFRSVYCVKQSDHYEILTGSDNNLVTFFANSEKKWSFETLDRVRETIIHDDLCLAVSEDRYLYVLNKEGKLEWKYKFPHRALCVDIYSTEEEEFFVVGCGDGYVYLLNRHGFIKYAYRFPDRIRDVKVYSETEIFVACEALETYFCPTIESFIQNQYGETVFSFINNKIGSIEENVQSKGLLYIKEIPLYEKLMLLEYIEIWSNAANSDIVISLFDSCKDGVAKINNIKVYYLYASALVTLATRVDFAVGKSRIEEYMNNADNSYIFHSMISVITNNNIKKKPQSKILSNPIVLIELIINNIKFSDEWILEEAILKLYESDFFSFEDYGFLSYFTNSKIEYKKICAIENYCHKLCHRGIEKSPFISLLKFLNQLQYTNDDFERIINICKLNNKGDSEVKKHIDYLFQINSEGTIAKCLDIIEKWISDRVTHKYLAKHFSDTIKNNCYDFEMGIAHFGTVKQMVEYQLIYENIELSSQDYLQIVFLFAFFNLLSEKFDKKHR